MNRWFGGYLPAVLSVLFWAGCDGTVVDDDTGDTAVGAFTVFRSSDGLASDVVTDVAVDYLRDGIWASTFGGISFYGNADSVFMTYGADYDIPSLKVRTIAVDYTGTVWAGTESGPASLVYGDSTWSALVDTENLVHRYITTIVPMTDFSLWFGTRGGVSVAGMDGWRSYTGELGQSREVTSISVSSTGETWIGTTNGIAVFDGAEWTWHGPEVLPNTYVNAVFRDGAGRIWCGTAMTMAMYDGSGWKTYGAASGLSAFGVYDFARDGDGVLWAGTDNGLFFLSGDVWNKLALPDAVDGAVVRSLAVDLRSGTLWIGTDAGLVRFTRM